MNSGSRNEEERIRFADKKKIAEESPEKLDEMLEESKRAGLFHELEKVAKRLRKKLSGEGPDKGTGKAEGALSTTTPSVETRDYRTGPPTTTPPGGAPPTAPPAPPGEIPSTPGDAYITRWDLLSEKSRLAALFYFDQFRWRYQYALVTPHLPGARYWKKKKKKKKKESDYTELFMIDDLFGDKDVSLIKVIESMV